MISSKCGGSPNSSVAHIEDHVEEVDDLQKTMLKLFNKLAEDFVTTIDTIKGEMIEINTQVSLTMRAVENHTPGQAHVRLNKLKILKPKAVEGN